MCVFISILSAVLPVTEGEISSFLTINVCILISSSFHLILCYVLSKILIHLKGIQTHIHKKRETDRVRESAETEKGERDLFQ